MVFLGEKGHDRLTLREEPEPQLEGKVLTTVHRITPGFGVVIRDGEGSERGALVPEGLSLILDLESSLGNPERPSASNEIRVLIRMMSRDNPLWGSPRIRGELLKLGREISETSVGPRSPWQWASIERVIGTIRRECLEHVIVLHKQSLRRRLRGFIDYYHRSRTQLSFCKGAPEPRTMQAPAAGRITVIAELGGLLHRYERRAA